MRSTVLLVVTLCLLVGCSKEETSSSERLTRRFFRMDTVTDILFFGGTNLSNEKVDSVSERVDSLLYSWEKRFSVGREKSEINLVNNRLHDTVLVSPELFDMVIDVVSYGDTLNGLFDITLLPLKEFWKPQCEECTDPDPLDPQTEVQIDSLKNLLNNESFTLLPPNRIVFFDSVTTIDLGGIAKGKVIEHLAVLMAEEQITDYLISSGGDIVGRGVKPDSSLFKVGVQEPRGDGLAALFTLENRAVVTSGDYERYRIAPSGERVHHLFDPRTLFPSTENQSVTIVADDPVEADILSTGLFHLTSTEILAFVNERPRLECLVIDSTGQKWFSSSFNMITTQ